MCCLRQGYTLVNVLLGDFIVWHDRVRLHKPTAHLCYIVWPIAPRYTPIEHVTALRTVGNYITRVSICDLNIDNIE